MTPERIVTAMQEVCDAAHETVRRWTHKGRCRVCDEAMETLMKKLNDLAEELDKEESDAAP